MRLSLDLMGKQTGFIRLKFALRCFEVHSMLQRPSQWLPTLVKKVAREELIMALRVAAERLIELQKSYNRIRNENDALVLDLAIKDKRI